MIDVLPIEIPTWMVTVGRALTVVGSALSLSGDTPKDIDYLVIGEGMANRVIPYATSIGAEFYVAPDAPREMWMENNRAWINDRMDRGYHIIDIGPESGRANYPAPTSPYYKMEREEITRRDYLLYYNVNAGY